MKKHYYKSDHSDIDLVIFEEKVIKDFVYNLYIKRDDIDDLKQIMWELYLLDEDFQDKYMEIDQDEYNALIDHFVSRMKLEILIKEQSDGKPI